MTGLDEATLASALADDRCRAHCARIAAYNQRARENDAELGAIHQTLHVDLAEMVAEGNAESPAADALRYWIATTQTALGLDVEPRPVWWRRMLRAL